MTILYAQPMQNISNEDSGQNEYLVIQRKLSEMKSSVLDEPSKESSETYHKSDLHKSIQILEKA